ncbi:MAG: M14 family metallopeptidase, partial [Pyrinomonadaceae bacterium]
DASRKLPLQSELTDKSNPLQFKGVEYKIEKSEISGTDRIIFGTKPLNLTIPFYDETRVTASAAPPLYYIIPPQYKSVISVLEAHGLKLKQLAAPATIEVESYRFSDVQWAPRPFEGRLHVSYKTNLAREKRTFAAGSVVVPMAQPAARVALYLLEPDSPDSLLSWGSFNSIFEQKEYGESYVLEKLAREMIEKNPALKQEFEQRVATDSAFASSPAERLRFFYERSPYWDLAFNLYPVGRITTQQEIKLIDFQDR